MSQKKIKFLLSFIWRHIVNIVRNNSNDKYFWWNIFLSSAMFFVHHQCDPLPGAGVSGDSVSLCYLLLRADFPPPLLHCSSSRYSILLSRLEAGVNSTLLYYHHLKILLLSVYQRPDSEAIIFVLTPTHQLNKNNTNLEINRQKLNSKLFSLFEAIKACGWWSWEFYWMKYFRFYLKRFCQEPINYRDWILLGLNFNLFLREKLCKYFVLIYVKVYVYLIPVFSVLISVDLCSVIFDAGVVTLYWDADMGLQWHGVSSRHWSQDRQCLKTISLQTQDIMRLGWVMAVVRNWFFTILHSMESSWKLSNRSE